MLKSFISKNINLCDKITPGFLIKSHCVSIFDWIGKSLIQNVPESGIIVDVGAGKTWHFKDVDMRNKLLIGIDDSAEEMKFNSYLDSKVVGNVCFDMNKIHSADLIISRMTMEHLENTESFVKGSYASLRKGGKLAVVFTNKWAPSAILNRILPRKVVKKLLHYLVPGSDGILGFQAYYDKCSYDEFRSVLIDAGFKIEYEYVSYYCSSYWRFFVPLFIFSIILDYIRMITGIKNMSSQCIFVARKD